MASHDQIPQKPTKARDLLNALMAGLSVVLGVIALFNGAMAIIRNPNWLAFLFILACALAAIVLGRLSRAKPTHLIGFVCVLTLLLLAVTPPWLPRRPPNQASAVGSLRTINTAETTYASTYPNGYSPTLSCLAPPGVETVGNPTPTAAGLIDSVLAGTGNISEKSGYHFVYSPGPRDEKGRINSYWITASPIQPGVTGNNYYYTDETGVIRQNTTGPAGPKDPPLAG